MRKKTFLRSGITNTRKSNSLPNGQSCTFNIWEGPQTLISLEKFYEDINWQIVYHTMWKALNESDRGKGRSDRGRIEHETLKGKDNQKYLLLI